MARLAKLILESVARQNVDYIHAYLLVAKQRGQIVEKGKKVWRWDSWVMAVRTDNETFLIPKNALKRWCAANNNLRMDAVLERTKYRVEDAGENIRVTAP